VGRVDLATLTISTLTPMGLTNADNIRAVAASPDGSVLAIAGTETAGGNAVINLYNLDGSGVPTTLYTASNASQIVSQIGFSPDGTRLAVRGDLGVDDNVINLYVLNTNGQGGLQQVSPTPTDLNQDVVQFRWVDNTTLAFAGDLITNNVDSIWTVDVTVGLASALELVPSALLASGQDVYNERIDVDAQGRIYFTGDWELENNLFRLYRIDADGQNLEQVPGTDIDAGGREASIGAFGLNAAGDTLAFSADATTVDVDEVFLLPLADTLPTRIDGFVVTDTYAQGPSSDEPILFSPDGSQLLFTADYALTVGDQNGATAVFVLATDGSGGVRLCGVPNTGALDAVGARFSPDGSTVLFRADYLADGDSALFATTDLSTPDQSPAAIVITTPPAGGSTYGLFVHDG
jgi:WD40 repeat protein